MALKIEDGNSRCRSIAAINILDKLQALPKTLNNKAQVFCNKKRTNHKGRKVGFIDTEISKLSL